MLEERARARDFGPWVSVDINSSSLDRMTLMARKPASRSEFVLFDVVYEDGSLRSNRRVPSSVLGGLDGDDPARQVIEEQDRAIAEKTGQAPLPVKTIRRSAKK